ncbi:MAG: glycosyltransferase [Leptolyngbyaceae cyanobacterium CRU_2_3]|nr:glycosyltransferase [Leptolyngbyaceae cyanobacterium CRU_2_3]
MNPLKLKSWIGRHVRESTVHIQRLQPASDLKVVFCVDGPRNGQSAGLRGYRIAEALRPLGWRSIVIPPQLDLSQRQRILKAEQPQILVLQSSRPLLNRPQLYPEQICVYDLDDADFLDPRDEAKQAVMNCATGSRAAIAGSHYIANFLKQYCQQVEVIWTGSTPLKYSQSPVKENPPIICWACANPHAMHEEASLIQEIMMGISGNLRCQFWLIGVQDLKKGEIFVQPMVDRGIPCKVFPFMPYNKLLDTLRSVSVGLAPLVIEKSPFSAGKSFGKVLAYLNTYTTVVASDCVEHPLFFRSGDNGILVSSLSEWVESVEFLLSNPHKSQHMAEKARADYETRLSTEEAAKRTDQLFRQVLNLS